MRYDIACKVYFAKQNVRRRLPYYIYAKMWSEIDLSQAIWMWKFELGCIIKSTKLIDSNDPNWSIDIYQSIVTKICPFHSQVPFWSRDNCLVLPLFSDWHARLMKDLPLQIPFKWIDANRAWFGHKNLLHLLSIFIHCY